MQLHHFNRVLIRTPLFPLEWAYARGMGPGGANSGGAISEDAGASAFSGLTLAQASLFAEGLYLSSPEFWMEWQKKDQLKGKALEKLHRTFTKYWLRSCVRCTPYATFAGCFLSTTDLSSTKAVLSPAHLRRVRTDMHFLTQITEAIAKMPEVIHQIKFYPNNSIYAYAGTYRYVEYSIDRGTRQYQITSVQGASYLDKLLKRAQGGVTLDALRDLLMQLEEVSLEEAKEFIMEMVDSQLLVSELEPALTGTDSFERLMRQLSALPSSVEISTSLQHIYRLLSNPGNGVGWIEEIGKAWRKLALLDTTAQAVQKNTLQVDLFLSMHPCHIQQGLIDAILSQAQDLSGLGRQDTPADLEAFRKRFLDKYEEAQVPLSLALDADTGIGFSSSTDDLAGNSPLINELSEEGSDPGPRTFKVDPVFEYLIRKYDDYLRHQESCIRLTEEELSALRSTARNSRFPSSMYLCGSLMKEGGLLDPENFVFDLHDFGGPGGANLLARFALGDDQIACFTREIIKKEEQADPGVLYAEVVHLPQARTGNVLLRPVLRDYEIPYVGGSGAEPSQLIPMDDLLVSVRHNEIILTSKRHQKRVLPRLTTAHNFLSDNLPIYKFLCLLSFQNLSGLRVWDWGPLTALEQLPRVVYKNLILSKAQWRITEAHLSDLPPLAADYPLYFQGWRTKLNMPERVVYVEQDNTLLIDFTQAAGIDLFLHYLSRNKKLLLMEFLDTPENAMVRDEQGRGYTQELIIPMEVTAAAVPATVPAAVPAAAVQRKFGPGSQWLYFKLYCGAKSAETILRDVLKPFLENMDGQYQSCFFLRYKDEFSHLRIRFYNQDLSLQGPLQQAFLSALQPWVTAGMIDRVVIDTYSRELERYGADLIGQSERLFSADSLFVLQLLDLLEGRESLRPLLALRSIDALLDDFGLTLDEKRSLMGTLQAAFYKEFGGSPLLQRQLNEKYRERQGTIFSYLNPALDYANGLADAITLLRQRSLSNQVIIGELLTSLPLGKVKPRSLEVLPSLIHMSVNRLFVARQRKYELVLYHFLEKYYTSQVAIRKGR